MAYNPAEPAVIAPTKLNNGALKYSILKGPLLGRGEGFAELFVGRG